MFILFLNLKFTTHIHRDGDNDKSYQRPFNPDSNDLKKNQKI